MSFSGSGADCVAVHASSGCGVLALCRSGEEYPLIDQAVLKDLEEQLELPDIAFRFARDFASLWGQRCHRLVAAVECRDGASALDAVISLKVSSAMVGGARLAQLAETLEVIIRGGDLNEGRMFLSVVASCGTATVKELQSSYMSKGQETV